MPPAFNLSQDQTLQFNLCFFRPFVKRDRFAHYSRRNWSGSFVAFSIFLCFKPWARDKSLCLVYLSRPLLCSFRFLSPRSRLSVRCLVFKELFVAAVAATRSKFYFISFRLVKSFSKNFLFFFSLFSFSGDKKESLFATHFLLPVKRGCELWSGFFRLSSPFVKYF